MPKFTCQVCPKDGAEPPFTTLSGMAMRRHLQEVHHKAPLAEGQTFIIHRDEEAELATLLQEAMYDRGDDVRTWPEDEAALYREERATSFQGAEWAVMELRYRKAARAIMEKGWHL